MKNFDIFVLLLTTWKNDDQMIESNDLFQKHVRCSSFMKCTLAEHIKSMFRNRKCIIYAPLSRISILVLFYSAFSLLPTTVRHNTFGFGFISEHLTDNQHNRQTDTVPNNRNCL